MKEITIAGKTREEAVTKASVELNVPIENLKIEVLEEPQKGLFGFIGKKECRIHATVIKNSPEETDIPVSNANQEKEDIKSDAPDAEETKELSKNDTTDAEETKELSKNDAPDAEETKELSKNDTTDTEKERETALETSEEFLKQIFDFTGLKGDIQLEFDKENNIRINVKGEDTSIFIGRRGDTLDSLQFLTMLAVNKKTEHYQRVILDIENYREKREESITHYADKMARIAVRQHRTVKLDYMNPYERRVVHSHLQGNRAVTTYSEGKEPYRRVVITLK